MKMKVQEGKKLPNGDYVARLDDIETRTGEFGEYLSFGFKLLDAPDDAPYDTVQGRCNAKLIVGQKLYKWLTALNGGKDFAIGDDVDVNDFKGKQCKIIIENKPGKKNPDIEYPNVKDVIPLRKGQEVEKKEAPKQEKKQDAEFEQPAKQPAPKVDEKDDF